MKKFIVSFAFSVCAAGAAVSCFGAFDDPAERPADSAVSGAAAAENNTSKRLKGHTSCRNQQAH
ncbi:MAG: hypothetical protein NC924_04160 [Candidatus Omnitrophica bacterium]|nr:hypothetical protein [Candidatus Omnitrophota bacterium]